jgi:hypothetical protein
VRAAWSSTRVGIFVRGSGRARIAASSSGRPWLAIGSQRRSGSSRASRAPWSSSRCTPSTRRRATMRPLCWTRRM